MGLTPNYGFTTIGSAGDGRLSDNDYKFTYADRLLNDRLHKRMATHHHMGGASTSIDAPLAGPIVNLSTTGGTIEAGTRVYYKFTLVDELGFESAPSPVSVIDTPDPIDTPGAPIITQTPTGGVLLPGTYHYGLTAWKGTYDQETRGGPCVTVTVPQGTNTNRITITFPTVPTYAEGFNIYRKSPGSNRYYFLTSQTTAQVQYQDVGTTSEDCVRTLPQYNTTMSNNKITVVYPGATPVVPAGYHWKIYRSFTPNNFDASFLYEIVEESAPGVIATNFVDTGGPTFSGSPPLTSQILDALEKINLEDGTEVQNRLPLGNVTAFPQVVTFGSAGQVQTSNGTIPWVCEFPRAKVVGIRASLGKGSTPAAQDVIVDVQKYNSAAATPTWSSIFTTNAKPKVAVSKMIGSVATPNTKTLVKGDALVVDVIQDGGGSTPTDNDLTVNILVLAQFDEDTSDETKWD